MTDPDTSRGQTLPDFVVAMFIFLLTMGFILAFVPQITAPYEAPEGPVVVDRIADDLARGVLADPAVAGGLDEPCTVVWFHDAPSVECDGADEPLEDRLDVDHRYRVNVTLTRPADGVVCANQSAITDCADPNGTRLAVGPITPDAGASVYTTRRLLHHQEQELLLEVRAWRP